MNVNMTKYTPQKCQKWQICGYHVCFIKPWILQNSFSAGLCPGSNWGAYDPRPPSRLGRVVGRGTPLPIPFPWILAALVHRLSSPTPLAHRLSGPQHKFLAMPMPELTIFFNIVSQNITNTSNQSAQRHWVTTADLYLLVNYYNARAEHKFTNTVKTEITQT